MINRKAQLVELEQQMNKAILATFKMRKAFHKQISVISWMGSYMGFPTIIYTTLTNIQNKFRLYKLNLSIKKLIKQRSDLKLAILLAR